MKQDEKLIWLYSPPRPVLILLWVERRENLERKKKHFKVIMINH